MPGTSNFPTALDTTSNLPDPAGTDILGNANPNLDHSYQHDVENSAIRALEAKVGITNSADSTSIDYKIRNGAAVRQSLSVTTVSLAPNATDSSKTIVCGNTSVLLSISPSHPCCIRIYATAAAQSADAGRSQTSDPISGIGVLFECITTTGGQVILVSPSALLYSLESSPGTTIPITVINNDNVSETITITYVILTLEQGA